MTTLDYYNKKAKEFSSRTIARDMAPHRNRFLKYLPTGARILDAGCGSGRDTKAFLQSGYSVVAFDASEELVRISKEVTGLETLQLRFQDLSFVDEFDGIWANASLLHVPYDELTEVLRRLHCSLKQSGILYASFKKGNKHRQVEERHFYDHDENTLNPLIKGLFTLEVFWNSEDTGIAANVTNEWYQVILRKIEGENETHSLKPSLTQNNAGVDKGVV